MNGWRDRTGLVLHTSALALAAAAAWQMPVLGAALFLVQSGLLLRAVAGGPDGERDVAPVADPAGAVADPAPVAPNAEAGDMTVLADFFEAIGQGDLARRLPEAAGPVAKAANEAATRIQTAVDEALAVADLMAGGDLSTRASGAYSGSFAALRDALNAVEDGLRQMLSAALEAAEAVAARSGEMQSACTSISGRVELQGRSMTELTATIDRLSESVATIGRRVAASNEATQAAGAVVERGQAATMAAGEALERMRADADSIRGILATIDSLAQQTNVLAINASIEAAKAGAAGRGFAVVSDEVRTLAGRTRSAAAEIREIVRRTGTSVQGCAREIEGCGALMTEIAGRMRDVEGISGEILSAAEDQRHLLEESRARMERLGQHAIETGGLIRAAGETAHGLGTVVGRLRSNLDRFRLSDETMIGEVTARAAEVARRFEAGLDDGRITEADLFSRDYVRIEGSEPAQYLAPVTAFTDAVLPDLLESALAIHEGVIFCAAVNSDGYLPTHNRRFSQNPRRDDPVWNAAHARNRRFFADRVGLAAGRSRADYLIQAYRRDMGGGTFVTMKDISAPITVRGRHWGGLRIGYRPFVASEAASAAA
jgi:methyl-accepting chemotaxis protein